VSSRVSALEGPPGSQAESPGGELLERGAGGRVREKERALE
jgi:hypothetical protein